MKPSTATAAPSASAVRNDANVSAADQRRVGEHHQDIVRGLRERGARRQHRMRGAEPFALLKDRGLRRDALCLGLDRRMIGSDHHSEAAPPACSAAVSTCASSERPPIACSTFGRLERMRVPSPAASTIARHVREGIRMGSNFSGKQRPHPIAEAMAETKGQPL